MGLLDRGLGTATTWLHGLPSPAWTLLRRVRGAARPLVGRERGAALTEMVVAMFLLGLTVPGVMGFLSTTTRAIGAAAQRQEALEKAVAQLEVIAYAPYDRTLDGVVCPAEVAAYGERLVAAGRYEIEIKACTQEKGSQRLTVTSRLAGGTIATFEVYKADR